MPQDVPWGWKSMPSRQRKSSPGPLGPAPALPEPASQGRPARTPHRPESQAGADVSAGLCGRSARQPTETRLLPGEPGFAFLPRRCCEHRPKLPVLPGGGRGSSPASFPEGNSSDRVLLLVGAPDLIFSKNRFECGQQSLTQTLCCSGKIELSI